MTLKWISIVLLAALISGAGCEKKAPPTPVFDGVTVDLPKLNQAFATAGPDIQPLVSEVTLGVRYSDYPRAFTALDKLAKTDGLTDPQKKIVAEVTAQVKALADKAPPAAPH